MSESIRLFPSPPPEKGPPIARGFHWTYLRYREEDDTFCVIVSTKTGMPVTIRCDDFDGVYLAVSKFMHDQLPAN